MEPTMDRISMAVSMFDKLANQYQEKFMDVSKYADTLDIFGNVLPKSNAAVVELGCGPGNITRYLLDKFPNLKILATDLAANMLKLGEINNPEAKFELMDCRDIGKLKEKYDGVMCGFCLPYLSKEESLELIESAAKSLNDNGVIYISTMEGDYSLSGLATSSQGDSVYRYFHEEGYLVSALEKHFNIIKIDRIRYQYGSSETVDLILIATKKSL
ncbi:hypothetical protein DLAC_08201 [Tieghemostelium lacteum]|uniref:Methyltransferase domain-containing protein n=1 Tax=Tieghemostelium lacteum TaxID=361077 RepID=A0A151ZBF0_TIELA|nr:hypothetical protein DLAC_08201 [Tieghemostelium lacteum]|eukprot:KYQ91266.1 hypothetical protein DLAC_08201 [Tieghemostelium lacteum]